MAQEPDLNPELVAEIETSLRDGISGHINEQIEAGKIPLLFLADEDEIRMVVEAWAHYADHECEWGEDVLGAFMGHIVKNLIAAAVSRGLLSAEDIPEVPDGE